MAINAFGRRKGDNGMGQATATTASPTPSPSGSSSGGLGNLTAFIDQGSEFEGKLSFKDTVRIEGSFAGEISSDNTLIVGETGEIHARIVSVCVVISGLVEGDIVATQQVVLHKTAVVNGDIEAPSLVIEEGAQLNGAIRMNMKSGSGASASGSPAEPKAPKPDQGGDSSK
jgi:cytoskeletal protein CcmA (bactofilin family)